tara:strand:- start:677 stop:1012 length:336 start_codon:yes stop_codon:yes gene_type:complete
MRKLKERVFRLLRTKPDTRKSYSLLMVMIWEGELNAKYNLPLTQLGYVLGSKHYKLSSAGSITRCAREIFKDNPELVDEETMKKRRKREEEMRQLYSKIGINYNQVNIGDK